MEKSRTTIAFLTRNVHDRMGLEMWQGLMERCRELDFSVVTFKGGLLGKEFSSVLYYMVKPDAYDGFVTWASSEADKWTIDYYQRFNSRPLAGLTLQIPGRPVIAADSKQGMIELLTHLIEVHNYQKIAFIRGPESHVYARERYDGYLETLKEFNIPFNEQLVSSPTNWNPPDGARALLELLDTRGLKPGKDFDVIVAVSDNQCMGVMDVLRERGISVPSDVAVCGYNASLEASCTTPPITTVSMPAALQGKKGVDSLKSLMAREPVEQQVFLPATVVLGQSCGCMSGSVKKSICGVNYYAPTKEPSCIQRLLHPFNPDKKAPVDVLSSPDSPGRGALLAGMAATLRENKSFAQIPVARVIELVTTLLDGFHDEILRNKKGEFISKLNTVLIRSANVCERQDIWQDVISDIRNGTVDEVQAVGRMALADNLWQQSRVFISETSSRNREAGYLKKMKSEALVRSIGVSLITTYDLTELMNVLTLSLGKLSIPSFYVALYDTVTFDLNNPVAPEYARLVLAKNDSGRATLPADGVKFKTENLIPDEYLPANRQYSLLVESLHFQNILLGYIVFESGPEDGSLYLCIRDQLASAIYGATVLSERTRVKTLMQESLGTMSEKADVVSGHSAKISDGVSEISTSMEEVAANIREISVHIKTVLDTVGSATSLVNEATEAINELTLSSQKIGEVVGMINDIAEKTNVLSLNAAIEAARAGESGRGFNVVAKEVKELAAQTVSATTQIQAIVGRNKENTADSKDAIVRTRKAMQKIFDLSTTITAAINQQAQATSDISGLLIDASQGTIEISGAIKEIARLGEGVRLD